jgi:cytoskeleton protein RodZ
VALDPELLKSGTAWPPVRSNKALPPQPEPYVEQPGPADSVETETLVAPDRQPVGDIETDPSSSENKPDKVTQTELPASELPAVSDTVVQPQAPANSDFENNDQAPSGDVSEQAKRKPRVYGEDNPGRIIMRAVEESWVEVTDADGEILFSRVLRKGDSYRAPARQGTTFVTGNAGGLEIFVDKQPAPALGPAGVVRRGVALDPELLKSGAAWPPASGQ